MSEKIKNNLSPILELENISNAIVKQIDAYFKG